MLHMPDFQPARFVGGVDLVGVSADLGEAPVALGGRVVHADPAVAPRGILRSCAGLPRWSCTVLVNLVPGYEL